MKKADKFSNYRILLYVDNSGRDLLGIKLLQSKFKLLGCETRICNHHTARLELARFRPDALIAPRGDNAVAKEASAQCRVFIVPGEGGHQTPETMMSVFMGRGHWKLSSVDWITTCYLWGSNTKKWLLDTGEFKPSQLKVSGNPRLDIYRYNDLSSCSNPNTSGKIRIGVAFSAKSTSAYYGKQYFANQYFDMRPDMTFPILQPDRYMEDILWRDHAILRSMMQTLRYILDSDLEAEIWLRPSPFEDPLQYKFLSKRYPNQVRLLPSQTLPEFVAGIDCLLTCWSTVGLEALILEKPVISISGLLNQQHLYSHISPKASGFETFVPYFYQPSSMKELTRLLFESSTNKLKPSPKSPQQVIDLLESLYSWSSVESSSELIANDVVKKLHASPCTQPKPRTKKQLTYANLPFGIVRFLIQLRKYFLAFKSGAPNSFLRFLAIKDVQVTRLLKSLNIP